VGGEKRGWVQKVPEEMIRITKLLVKRGGSKQVDVIYEASMPFGSVKNRPRVGKKIKRERNLLRMSPEKLKRGKDSLKVRFRWLVEPL